MASSVRDGIVKLVGELDWLAARTSRELRSRVGGIQRRFRTPPKPINPNGEVLIHLGCGGVAAKGFINVDGKALPHIHHVADLSTLPMFETGSADLVYACHVLEHFPQEEQRTVLWEWARVLKPGGVLRIAVPDFDKLLTIYQACDNEVHAIGGPLMGIADGYSPHRWIFNDAYLRDVFKQAGLREVRPWDPATAPHHDFEDWASREVTRGGKQYPLSLNLEGIK